MKEEIVEGTENIFKDLGFEDYEDMLVKAQLVRQIEIIVKRKKLTQQAIAHQLGIDQPKVSALLNGKLTQFSIERLLHFIQKLKNDIEIRVKPQTRKQHKGRIKVIMKK